MCHENQDSVWMIVPKAVFSMSLSGMHCIIHPIVQQLDIALHRPLTAYLLTRFYLVQLPACMFRIFSYNIPKWLITFLGRPCCVFRIRDLVYDRPHCIAEQQARISSAVFRFNFLSKVANFFK